jgi:hypothetical protein
MVTVFCGRMPYAIKTAGCSVSVTGCMTMSVGVSCILIVDFVLYETSHHNVRL